MNGKAKGVEVDTQRTAGRPQVCTHAANQKRLREQFGYIDPNVRAMLLNIIEANARHWYATAGGNAADFEILFNNETR